MRSVRCLLALAALGCAPRSVAAEPLPNQPLADLFAAEWDWRLREFPESATFIGVKKYNAEWTDFSAAARGRRQTHRSEVLKSLEKFDPAALSAADRLNLTIFRKEYEADNEAETRRTYLTPLNHMEGVHDLSGLMDAIPFDEPRDFADWAARLTKLPGLIDQTIDLMREGMKAGRVQTRVTVDRTLSVVRRLDVDDPTKSPLFRPFTKYPAGVPGAEREKLTKAGRTAVADHAVPAYRKLARFLETEYRPACYEGVGVWHLADGADLYRYYAKLHTTTDMTPDAIHAAGLAEVARIRAEMDGIVKKVGFRGSFPEFLTHLRTDPKFYFTKPDELLTETRRICTQVEKQLPRLFGTIPKAKFVVEPVPAFVAPDAPMAYYLWPSADGRRPGTYYINTYKPESRARYQLEALCLHEAVPGHHFQISRAFELEGQPAFRRFSMTGYTAYIEGWALYTEGLGDDLGLYTDPYSKFGRLSEEMLRAVRLVVDTGMHHKKWTRQQAIDFAAANCASSVHEIETEIDRYAAWPGQALAYKVGEIQIRELRAKAAKTLGPKFDVKAFHDTVLNVGAVPLDVLTDAVDAWTSGKK